MAKSQIKKLESKYYRAEEVAEMMDCSVSQAYLTIRGLNAELEQMGRITLAGRVGKRYFEEKLYV
jgi:hypothetical protein